MRDEALFNRMLETRMGRARVARTSRGGHRGGNPDLLAVLFGPNMIPIESGQAPLFRAPKSFGAKQRHAGHLRNRQSVIDRAPFGQPLDERSISRITVGLLRWRRLIDSRVAIL